MQIVGVEFADPSACKYDRLARVWQYSAQKAHPDATVRLLKLDPPNKRRTSHQMRNHIKLYHWKQTIKYATENTILMDVDMLVLKDIEHVFAETFDICYTKRVGTRMPLNGGVVFVKPTDLAKSFFGKWYKADEAILKARGQYGTFVHRYGGQNQASFGYMLEKGKHPAHIKSVPCPVYNCCNESWTGINEETRVIHCKGPMKRYLSRSGEKKILKPEQEKIAKLWKTFEKESRDG